MQRPENTATPPTGTRRNEPPRLAAGPAANESVTVLLAVVTVLPSASTTATCTEGLMVAVAAVVAGCVRNASPAGGPAATVKALLRAVASAPETARSV